MGNLNSSRDQLNPNPLDFNHTYKKQAKMGIEYPEDEKCNQFEKWFRMEHKKDVNKNKRPFMYRVEEDFNLYNCRFTRKLEKYGWTCEKYTYGPTDETTYVVDKKINQ